MSLKNTPALSRRAEMALEILANGGELVHRLERNSYTGRDQFQTRFCTSAAWSSAVKGLGLATRTELERAGFCFRLANSTSVSSHYKLNHA
ncbi:MAG: hypothetical protein WAW13_00525 [Minisyncoccia bacterium]